VVAGKGEEGSVLEGDLGCMRKRIVRDSKVTTGFTSFTSQQRDSKIAEPTFAGFTSIFSLGKVPSKKL